MHSISFNCVHIYQFIFRQRDFNYRINRDWCWTVGTWRSELLAAGRCWQVSAPPALLAQNVDSVLAPLVQAVPLGDSKESHDAQNFVV